MRRYLSTARRYRWLLVAILALVWGAGLAGAYVEYMTTFESAATIWVLRASPELAQTSPDDPNVTLFQTAASQHADLIKQLLQTDSFVREVVDRTPLSAALAAAPDERRYLDQIRRRFRVQAIGTNVLTLSFAAREPHIGPQMVNAALAVREERVAQARVAATTALTALYQKDYEVSQQHALDAQRRLDQFNASHPPPLSEADQHVHAQLRLTLDLAQVRLADLRGRMDRAVLAPALLEISGMEFQVVDEPREETSPRGGARAAMTLAAVAVVAGLALAALLILVGTLLVDHVHGPADLGRLERATLFATVPHVAGSNDPDTRDVRSALAARVFGDGHADPQGVDTDARRAADEAEAWR